MGNKLYNSVSLLGWVTVQILTTSVLLTEKEAMRGTTSEQFALPIYLTQMLQVMQILDIVFILVGISKGSIVSSIAQISGRLLVALVYMSTNISPIPIANVLIAWSLAETNRYLYYKNSITTWLRYNGFLVLYPIGIYGEITLINDYLAKNSLTEQQVMLVRVSQAVILIGGLFLFVYMLGNRRVKSTGTHKKDNRDVEQIEVKVKDQLPSPPSKKRD
jgi:very-long-chain (3R)-3-hydroxyacyl-CoA dehydratase